MQFDVRSLSNLMYRAPVITISDERIDMIYSRGTTGEVDFLRFRLGRQLSCFLLLRYQPYSKYRIIIK